MITTSNRHGSFVAACYTIPHMKSFTLIYVNPTLDPEEVVWRRENLLEYADQALLSKMDERSRKAICTIISANRIGHNPSLPASIAKQYEMVLRGISAKLPTLFIAAPTCRFYPAPSMIPNQRDSIVIGGSGGAGKSWVAGNYCESHKRLYPQRKIYLISNKPIDEAFDALPYVQRIPPSEWEAFIGVMPKEADEKRKVKPKRKPKPKPKPKPKKEKEPAKKKRKVKEGEEADMDMETKDSSGSSSNAVIDLEPDEEKAEVEAEMEVEEEEEEIVVRNIADFQSSLFVFDDINFIAPDRMRTKVHMFKDFLCELGRSFHINVVYCTHLSMKGAESSTALNECTGMVFFPCAPSGCYHYEAYMKQYLKFPQRVIDKILDRSNRWIMLNMQHPRFLLTENKLMLLDSLITQNE